MTPDGRFIVSGSKDKSIKIFDLEKLQEVHHFKNIHEGKKSQLNTHQLINQKRCNKISCSDSR